MQPIHTFSIAGQPGIFRDWTLNSSPGWTDGQYTRFFENRPKKIGGWTQISGLGLSPNNTPFSATGAEPLNYEEIMTVGTIRKIYSYLVDNIYIIIVGADINNNYPDLSSTINPDDVLYPSGLFIGITDDTLVLPLKFYPVRFQQYLIQNGAEQVPTTFIPGAYSWCISIYGVSTGGPNTVPNSLNLADSAFNSLAVVAYASPSLKNKASTQDNYVFFALLSDMLNFNSPKNYVLDPCLASFPDNIGWVEYTMATNQTWTSGAYGNGLFVFVAISSISVFNISYDGMNWQAPGIPLTGSYYTISFGSGLFVTPAFGTDSCLISYDGLNWLEETLTISDNWTLSVFGEARFLLLSSTTGNTQLSTDGVNWVAGTTLTVYTYTGLIFGNGLFITVAYSTNIVAISPDGIMWSYGSLPVVSTWIDVVYGDGIYIAISQSSVAAVSYDGITWQSITLPISLRFSSIDFGNNQFTIIANNSTVVLNSYNGLDWSINDMLPSARAWIDVVYGNGINVAVATVTNIVAISSAFSENIKYVYSPFMYPLTQYPIGGINGYNTNQPFDLPVPNDPQAIYATSEIYITGGVETIGPFLVAYSNNGLVRNSSSNDPGVWFNNGNTYFNQNPLLANDNNIDNYKVIKVGTIRTGANLSFLIITTNTVTIATFCGVPGIFSYATISFSSSIISAASVIEHNNIHYWVGEIAFFQCDGNTLSEIPNTANKNWFFDNLTYTDRAKTWSFKNPRFNEIWFVAPMFGSQEPNHAIIFNYVLNTWYDTPWNFSAGHFNMAYYRPLLCGQMLPIDTDFLVTPPDGISFPMTWQTVLGNNLSGPAIWIGETGVDQITLGVNDPLITPIPAYITSGNIGWTSGGPNSNVQPITNKILIQKIEPDIQGNGTNYISISARDYPLSEMSQLFYGSYTIGQGEYATYFSPNVQGRLMTITFGCNGINATFHYGECIISAIDGDARP